MEIAIGKGLGEISKIEAAQRQLDMAIELFFGERDPVSIHTLAAAASQVLHDLCKTEGLPVSYDTIIEPNIRNGIPKKEIREVYREHRNFFKHGSKKNGKPESKNDKIPLFSQVMNKALIWEAITDYETIMGVKTNNMTSFFIWICLCYPKTLDVETSYIPLNAHLEKYHNLIIEPLEEKDHIRVGALLNLLSNSQIDETIELTKYFEGKGIYGLGKRIAEFTKGVA